QLAAAVELPQLCVAPDRPAVDEDLRHRPAARQVEQAPPKGRIVVERDLLVLDTTRIEQRLRADAVAAPARRIHLNPWHHDLEHVRIGRRFPDLTRIYTSVGG